MDALGASISGSASRDAMTFSAGGLSDSRALSTLLAGHRASEPRRPRVRAPQASSPRRHEEQLNRGQASRTGAAQADVQRRPTRYAHQ